MVLLDINEKAGAERVKELGPKNCHFLPCDVTDEGQVKKAFEEANKVFGDIRTYVNCAGIFLGDTILNENGTHDTSVFKKVIDVNLFGSFLCSSLAAWHLQKVPLEEKERGVIINASSIFAKHSRIGAAAYGASKGGLEGMLLPFARELGRLKIRVVNIAPGAIDTPILDVFSEEVLNAQRALAIRGELGKPEHYAQVVESIITNGYLNGTSIELHDGTIIPHIVDSM